MVSAIVKDIPKKNTDQATLEGSPSLVFQEHPSQRLGNAAESRWTCVVVELHENVIPKMRCVAAKNETAELF
jgi:hypothetical protein